MSTQPSAAVTRTADAPTLPGRCALVSVIVPVYNAAGTIAAQLEALRTQVYGGEWEIVIVNNRCTDDTLEAIEPYRRSMPQLRVVDAPHRQGRAYACNVGAQEAAGDVLIFCDGDDVAAPGWLAAHARSLAHHDLVAGAIEIRGLNSGAYWLHRDTDWVLRPRLGFLPAAPGGNFAVSRSAFLAVGGFCEQAPFCEDIELSWRMQLHGYDVHLCPEAVMHVRYRTEPSAMWRQTVRFAEAHVYLYRKFASHGMPAPPPGAWRRRYRKLLHDALRLPRLEPPARADWLRRLAVTWGYLRGSIRYRTRYF
jgi:glycosyltransferase involved in cell wall biosynthesis